MYHGIIHRNLFQRGCEAFTLLELLVVIAIIGLIAGIALPAFKGMGRSNVTTSAQRQLLDDFALARQRAIANRSTVYVVFVPPGIINVNPEAVPDPVTPRPLTPVEKRVYTNLLAGQYTTYAIVAARQVGDQPGTQTWRYLTDWRTLPDGTYISIAKFGNTIVQGVRPFATNSIPFPLATSPPQKLPSIAFNYLGQLSTPNDELVPIVRGSIFYHRDANGQFDRFAPDIVENPSGNSDPNSSMWMAVRVDWLTGRALLQQTQVQ